MRRGDCAVTARNSRLGIRVGNPAASIHLRCMHHAALLHLDAPAARLATRGKPASSAGIGGEASSRFNRPFRALFREGASWREANWRLQLSERDGISIR